jgi:colanic acid/amylovoran biosynthesis glycosyltransferase
VRIIYVTARLPHGANEAFIVPEIRQIVRAGHDVLVIPRSPRGAILHGTELLNRSFRKGVFSPGVLKTAINTALSGPRQTAEAIRLLAGSRSLAVSLKNAAVVAKALWLADTAVRWKADHIHCHWSGTTATTAMLASARSGVPWSLTAHRWDIVENNLLAAKVKSASFVRFISEDGLRMARSIGIGPAENARVLHMGAAIPAVPGRRPGTARVVLCPARLVEVKGHRYLLEAWRIVQRRSPGGKLWLAGTGELRPELEALSARLGLGKSVRFLGAFRHSVLLKMYEEGAVSAVVLASLDLGDGHHEGIPVALIEAMSYAIPVVATAAGGTPELVTPRTGLLVPPADAAAFADAIERVVTGGVYSEQLGLAGRERVLADFNIVRVASALVSEFEAAAKGRVLARASNY